jgi:hypothetical protein
MTVCLQIFGTHTWFIECTENVEEMNKWMDG